MSLSEEVVILSKAKDLHRPERRFFVALLLRMTL